MLLGNDELYRRNNRLIMKKEIEWFNKLGKTRREELSFNYYGRDLLLDEEITAIYNQECRYYIEFIGKKFVCWFPNGEEKNNKQFKTLNEALDYMLVDCCISEVTIKN